MSGNVQVSALPVRQRTVVGQTPFYPIEIAMEKLGITFA
jgi:hypothetical protein